MCENSSEPQLLHHTMLTNPDGLAVDWVGRNLYWCDKGTDRIEVSTLDGRHRKTLISKGLREPRAIALLPQKGYLFWTDWSERPHIGRAGMDGSGYTHIVTEGLGWPNGLTVDYEANHLYWADAREDYIAMCDFNGDNRRKLADRITHLKIKLHHVFAIAVFESYIFWTDWETKTVERCTKYAIDDCKTIANTIHRPMDIHVLHPFKQPKVSPNPCDGLNCSALCLLKPGVNASMPPTASCACPNDFMVDPARPSACIANCTPPQIPCATTYKCINSWWKCDGQDDCGDRSDEPPECPPFVCYPGQFQCDNKNCTHPSHICNGNDDCGDRSDEKDCNGYNCMESQFKCPPTANTTAQCIPNSARCNGAVECPGGEDEANCKEMCTDTDRFVCNNGHCIPVVWVCDLADDCGDKSDENITMCATRQCSKDEHRCNTGRCLPKTWVCDGTQECNDGSDEPKSCKDNVTCDPTYFKCNNLKCIPGRWKCDMENDCGDNSDEELCTPRPCSESEFKCQNGRCIQASMRCDGEIQCEDQSDELDCQVECSKQEFKCVSHPHCIPRDWLCDRDSDCRDNSDESNCTQKLPCGPMAFSCGTACIPLQWICDNDSDCPNGEDETIELCSSQQCPPDKFRCANHKCVPHFKKCNGPDDCGDFSDEKPEVCQKHESCNGEMDCLDQSDEKGCAAQVCAVGACSQLCIVKEGRGFACRCAEGYSMYNNVSCKAHGSSGWLIVATDKDVRLVDPYKDNEKDALRSRIAFKVPDGELMTGVVMDIADRVLFPVFPQRIMSSTLEPVSDSKSAFKTATPIHETSPLYGPDSVIHTVDYDWTTKTFYVARDSDLYAFRKSNETGQLQYKTLLQETGQVLDLVLDVERSLMFWCEIVKRDAIISVAHMDGTNARTLLTSKRRGEISWPTDLAIDRATGRLYYADIKRRTIESISVTGKDRRVVYSAPDRKDVPFKIEVFEDHIYIVTYHSFKILKRHKFSIGNVTSNVGLSEYTSHRVVSLSMMQSQVQNVTNDTCNDFCHETAMCLRTPSGPVCVCPDDLVPEKKTLSRGRSLVCKGAVCNLNCHQGKCQMGANGIPYCKCDPLYAGARCEIYRCSGHCKNRGTCYVDTAMPPDPKTGLYPLKCHCPNEWSGDRCQTPDKCCLNGGTCLNLEKGLNKCSCPPGYTGQWCELCPDLGCTNGAICLRDEFGRPACNCTPGFEGERCERPHCHGFCHHNGTCVMTQFGPTCTCQFPYAGKRCEKEKIRCANGGTLYNNSGLVTCECPQPWVGPECQVDACSCSCQPSDSGPPNPPKAICYCPNVKPSYCPKPPKPTEYCSCLNGGSCVHLDPSSGQQVCRCTEDYIGTECEIQYLGLVNPCKDHCMGGGVCTLVQASDQPICTCLDNRRAGDRCQDCLLTCPEDFCVDQDECACVECGSGASTALVLTSVLVLLLVPLAFSYCHVRRKARRRGFDHSRIRENVEITNPMYEGHHELTDELPTPSESVRSALNLSRNSRGNFDNPVYAMMEEKTNLLEAG